MVSIAGEIDNLLLYTENELKFQLQTVVLRLLQDLLLAAEFIIHKRMNLWKYHFNEKLYIYSISFSCFILDIVYKVRAHIVEHFTTVIYSFEKKYRK